MNELKALLVILIMCAASFAPVIGDRDTDGDGFSDKYERMLGTDPYDAADFPDSSSVRVVLSPQVVKTSDTMGITVATEAAAEVFLSIYREGPGLVKVVTYSGYQTDGEAVFSFTPLQPGVYYFVAEVDHATYYRTTAELTACRIDCGYAVGAAYQPYYATVDSPFRHYIEGMAARVTVHLYAFTGADEAVLAEYSHTFNPADAMVLYSPAEGDVEVLGAYHHVPAAGTVLELDLQPGENTVRAVPAGAAEDWYTDSITLYCHQRYFAHIRGPGALRTGVHAVYSAVVYSLENADLDELNQKFTGSISETFSIHPEIFTEVDPSPVMRLYFSGSPPLLEGTGTGTLDYTFTVPGAYLIQMEKWGCSMEVLVFPSHATHIVMRHLYIGTGNITATAVTLDADVRGMAFFLDHRHIGNATVNRGQAVIELSNLTPGQHVLEAVPLVKDAWRIYRHMGLSAFPDTWKGIFSFSIRALSIYAVMPSEMIRGRYASFRTVVLGADGPCDGCHVTALLSNGVEVFSGTTDGHGAVTVSFRVPDMYFTHITLYAYSGIHSESLVVPVRLSSWSPVGAAVTSKPVYSPGETVRMAVMLEGVSGVHTLEVYDGGGRTVYSSQVLFDPRGRTTVSFTLSEEASSGIYTAAVDGRQITSGFRVQKYTLESVRLLIDTPDLWVEAGADTTVTFRALYSFGKELNEGRVKYTFRYGSRVLASGELPIDRAAVSFHVPELQDGSEITIEAQFSDELGHQAEAQGTLLAARKTVSYTLSMEVPDIVYPGAELLIRCDERTLYRGEVSSSPADGAATITVTDPYGGMHTHTVQLSDGTYRGAVEDYMQEEGYYTLEVRCMGQKASKTVQFMKERYSMEVQYSGGGLRIAIRAEDAVAHSQVGAEYSFTVTGEVPLYTESGTFTGELSTEWPVPDGLTGTLKVAASVNGAEIVREVQLPGTPSISVRASAVRYSPGDSILFSYSASQSPVYMDVLGPDSCTSMTSALTEGGMSVDVTWHGGAVAVAYIFTPSGEMVWDSVSVHEKAPMLALSLNQERYRPGDVVVVQLESSLSGAPVVLRAVDSRLSELYSQDPAGDEHSISAEVASPQSMPQLGQGSFQEAAAYYGVEPVEYADPDGDGLVNLQEYVLGTAMDRSDTDGDGLSDLFEAEHDLNPLEPDLDSDVDADGMPDAWEVKHGLSPEVNDSGGDADRDGLSNIEEYLNGTYPDRYDTDMDGMDDLWELTYGLDPLRDDAYGDENGDGLRNIEEYLMHRAPARPVGAGEDVDTDRGGIPDSWELRYGLDIYDPSDDTQDTDADGLTNLEEYAIGSNPRDPNTDGDAYVRDGDDPDPLVSNTNSIGGSGSGGGSSGGQGGGNGANGGDAGSGAGGPPGTPPPQGSGQGDLDTDGDGILDAQEFEMGTNPYSPDSDGDGIWDNVDPDPLNGAVYGSEGGGESGIPPFVPRGAASPEEMGGIHVRRWFTDVAYWSPDLMLNGTLRVSFVLPDSLCTWRLEAFALSPAGIAHAETQFEVSKDLMVEARAPASAVQDDELVVYARVYSFEPHSADVEVTLSAGGWLEVFGDATRHVRIDAFGTLDVPFRVRVVGTGHKELFMSVRDGGGNADAVSHSMLVRHNAGLKIDHASGKAGDSFTYTYLRTAVERPDAWIVLEPGLRGMLEDALSGLRDYRYDCTEQSMAKLLSNYYLWKLRGGSHLQGEIQKGLERIYSLQHSDGGWGWWARDASDPWMTSYVLLGLTELRDGGVEVDGNVIAGALVYIISQSEGVYWKGVSWLGDGDTSMTAVAAYSLARAGITNLTDTLEWVRERAGDPYQLALLGLTELTLGMDADSTHDKLLSMMKDSHWESTQALGGDLDATGWALYFMVLYDSQSDAVEEVLTYLASHRGVNGMWGTTSDSLSIIRAISAVPAFHEENTTVVTVNGEVVWSGKVTSRMELNISDRLVKGENALEIAGSGSYYRFTGKQYVRGEVRVSIPEHVQAAASGVVEVPTDVNIPSADGVRIEHLSISIPSHGGLVHLSTRKAGDGRYIHSFGALRPGRYTIGPVVVTYQIDAGSGPSDTIRQYLPSLQVEVKGGAAELEPDNSVFRDTVKVTKDVKSRSLRKGESTQVSIELESHEGAATVVDFVPSGMKVSDVSSGGTYSNGTVIWKDPGEKVLTYTITPEEEFEGTLGRAAVLNESGLVGWSEDVGVTSLPYSIVKSAEITPSGDVVVNLHVASTEELWYVAVEDAVPPGMVLDTELLNRELSDNLLTYTVSGQNITFFLRTVASEDITYTLHPVSDGIVVLDSARMYPMYSPEQVAVSQGMSLNLSTGMESGGVEETSTGSEAESPTARLEGVVYAPSTAQENGEYHIAVCVRNTGSAPASEQLVLQNDSRVLHSWYVEVEPGDAVCMNTQWVPDTPGKHTIAAGVGNSTLSEATVFVEGEKADAQKNPDIQGYVLLLILPSAAVVLLAAAFRKRNNP